MLENRRFLPLFCAFFVFFWHFLTKNTPITLNDSGYHGHAVWPVWYAHRPRSKHQSFPSSHTWSHAHRHDLRCYPLRCAVISYWVIKWAPSVTTLSSAPRPFGAYALSCLCFYTFCDIDCTRSLSLSYALDYCSFGFPRILCAYQISEFNMSQQLRDSTLIIGVAVRVGRIALSVSLYSYITS